jgi:hypothetical protein
VVVLFQNDIRRVLTRVGTQPFMRGARHQRELQAVEEVVKAAVALAHKRIGGLIVFERDALLDEFIQMGTVLDASVSKELLYSLFVPSHENPMHDGAVIIREGRLWQAGVFLPLTGSPKLDRSLGTRHRAAIGISEETDAVVVVVSEERGAIGICFNGNMVRDLDAGSLRQALLGLFQVPVKKRAAAKPDGKRRDETGRTSLTSVPPPASLSVPPGRADATPRSELQRRSDPDAGSKARKSEPGDAGRKSEPTSEPTNDASKIDPTGIDPNGEPTKGASTKGEPTKSEPTKSEPTKGEPSLAELAKGLATERAIEVRSDTPIDPLAPITTETAIPRDGGAGGA